MAFQTSWTLGCSTTWPCKELSLENDWMSFAKAAVQEGWIEALGFTGP